MVVRPMPLKPITQCSRSLNFHPTAAWPDVLPALAWRGLLLCGFERPRGEALELGESSFVEVVKAAHPVLALAELARLLDALTRTFPNVEVAEFREPLLNAYGLRGNERLKQTFSVLVGTPMKFQTWVDEKKLGTRDLAPLLALPEPTEFHPFLGALTQLPISKSDGVRALELGVELFLLGHPLNDLLPSTDNVASYLARLEKWRRPRAAAQDEAWRADIAQWPWPTQTHGQWQRVGDEAGLEIKIRATSPQDLMKKLERLESIRATWSCKI